MDVNKEFFEKEIRANTYKGMYAMHKYWAKKPYNVVAEYIKHFTKEGDIVFDPFCGSGVVITESLLNNRKAIANDLNPVSIFITEKTTQPIDINKFEEVFNKIKKEVKPIVDELYTITCPICNDFVIITHSIWEGETPKKMWFKCKKCNKNHTLSISEEFLNKMEEVNKREITYWYPDVIMKENSRINVKRNQKIRDLFTHRNLIATSIIFNAIQMIEDANIKQMMEFVFTSAVPQMTKLMFVIKRRGKNNGLEKEELGSWVAGYWMPKNRFELNAWNFFENRFKRIIKGKQESNKIELYSQGNNIFYYNESAKDLSSIQDESVDFIFTDPPYADYVPYFEQSLLWASWLKKNIDFDNEIVISNSPERNKNKEEYLKDLELAFKTIGKKLKPNKFMTVTFNNVEPNIWKGFMNALENAGFKLVNIKSICASARSVVQDSRAGSLKGDLYLTFQKTTNTNDINENNSVLESNYILNKINEFITTNGNATYDEISSYIVPHMIENRLITEENDLRKILKKNFILSNNKWHINKKQKTLLEF